MNKQKYTFRLSNLDQMKKEARRLKEKFNAYIDRLLITHPERKK